MKIKGWNDVSIALYEKMELEMNKHEDQLLRTAAKYAVLLGKSMDDMRVLPWDEFRKIGEDNPWMSQAPRPKKQKSWDGGRLVYDINKAQANTFIDMNEVIASGKSTLHEHCALLWDCDLNRFDSFQEKADYVHNNMPITIARGTHDFFLHRIKVLERFFPRFLAIHQKWQKTKKRVTELRQGLSKTIGGLFGSKQ